MGEGSNKPTISIVLGSYNRRRFLKRTIESVRNSAIDAPYEIIVIDGGSTDGSIRWLMGQKDIVTMVQHNHGVWNGSPIVRRNWGYYMNIGFRASHGKYVVMISDDCLLAPDAIQNAYELFERGSHEGDRLGALAFYWKNWPEQELYFVIKIFGRYYNVNHGMYLRSALDEVGWIDEDSYLFYYGDADLSLRIHDAGYHIGVSERSFVEHFSHANRRVRGSHNKAVEHDEKVFHDRWSHLKPRSMEYNEYERVRFERDPSVYSPFVRSDILFYIGWNIRKKVVKFFPDRMKRAVIDVYHQVMD